MADRREPVCPLLRQDGVRRDDCQRRAAVRRLRSSLEGLRAGADQRIAVLKAAAVRARPVDRCTTLGIDDIASGVDRGQRARDEAGGSVRIAGEPLARRADAALQAADSSRNVVEEVEVAG